VASGADSRDSGRGGFPAWSGRKSFIWVFTYSLQTNFSLLFLRGISAEHLAAGRNDAGLHVEYVQHLYRSIGDEEAACLTVPETFGNS
jgi:hypothetical protein